MLQFRRCLELGSTLVPAVETEREPRNAVFSLLSDGSPRRRRHLVVPASGAARRSAFSALSASWDSVHSSWRVLASFGPACYLCNDAQRAPQP